MKRIDILPDDVLLEIFDFYVDMPRELLLLFEEDLFWQSLYHVCLWQSLVHVCRRWRYLVFGSPRRLNLRLRCTPERTTRDRLDVWPALPLAVYCYSVDPMIYVYYGTDHVIAALGQSNRVHDVHLCGLDSSDLEEVLAAMQVPFPELTRMSLSFDVRPVPDSFLGGSAPRLQYFKLIGTPFPALQKLLLSATHLVQLHLSNIPQSGYISPEAIVAPLSVLSSLEKLSLKFDSPYLESRSSPPPKRSILPALEHFRFKGATEYLENLLTIIDAPQLNTLKITFFDQINFHAQRLAQFINRTPKLGKHDEAQVRFGCMGVRVLFGTLDIFIECGIPAQWLSFVIHVCGSSSPSTVEDLYMERLESHYTAIEEAAAIKGTVPSLWLQLLLPFTAVKNLYLSREFAPGIAAALQELVGSRITEVLPSLQNIFVEGLQPSGPFQENDGQFVAARQLSDHPIAISVWDACKKPM